MTQFWEQKHVDTNHHFGFELEASAEIAFHLVQSFGAVAGRRGPDDGTGRASVELQSPQELVTRCFAIADAFIAECEQRGSIKPASDLTDEERAKEIGRLESIRSAAAFAEIRATATKD